jgi:hypothetical protein
VYTVEALLHGNYSTTDNTTELTPRHRVFLEKCNHSPDLRIPF